MNNRRSILILTVAFALLFGFLGANVHPAFAASASISGGCTPIITFTGGVLGNTYQVLENGVVKWTYSALNGTAIVTRDSPLSSTATITATENGVSLASAVVSGCSAGSAVTFWDPGDGSVNRKPADRLAIWCNAKGTPPNVDVWGVDLKGKGTRLVTIPYADLVAAGVNGLAKQLGANGVLYVGMGADKKTMWFSWQGGPLNATGKGDFAKTVVCAF